MNKMNHIALVAITALLLGTGVAGAFDPIGVNETVNPTPQDGLNDAAMPSDQDHLDKAILTDPEGGLNKAILTDPEGGLNDAVLSGRQQLRVALKNGTLVLDCSVGGTDILIANAGSIDIPAGTKLKWSVRSHGAQGYVQLKQGLEAGADVRVADVLDAAAKAGTPCAVKPTGL
jgi:hypothetical protein